MTRVETVNRAENAPQVAATASEEERARVLRSYGLDSLEDDPELAAIVQFAARLCETPLSLVSLVEEHRQRFLAREGIEDRETPRSVSFCAHAMLTTDGLEVTNATTDERFADNPLVTGEKHIRFYFGQPLISDEGTPLGALCVIDIEPRPDGLTDLQRQGMQVLGKAVMRRLRARRESIATRLKLERSDAHLRALADSLPDIAFSADAEGGFEYFNRRWTEFCGPDRANSSHASPENIHPDDQSEVGDKWTDAVRNRKPYEVEKRLLRADGEWRWMLIRAVPVLDDAGEILRWFGSMTDVHDARELSETRDVLAKELSHRIKNIFAVVAGLVSLNSRRRPELKEFSDEIIASIRALGRAHDFVRPTGSTGRSSLQGLLTELFAPYGRGEGGRVHISGDELAIQARAASPLALVFHELATNAAKYGALSNATGHVDVDVKDEGEVLAITWTECGGPSADREAAMTEGFGSRLIEMSLKGQLGGSWERRFEEEGLVVDLIVAKKAIEATD